MSEQNLTVENSGKDVEKLVNPLSAGALLRSAREAQGLHIAMLSVSLKVPIRKLEALESDRYDLLPDMVFVRALAGSVCRALRIDAEPVLSALPRSGQPKIKIDEAGLNTAYDDSSSTAVQSLSQHLRKPLSVVVALVIVAILAIVFLPDNLIGNNWSRSNSEDSLSAQSDKPVAPEATESPVSAATSISGVTSADSEHPVESAVVQTLQGPSSTASSDSIQKSVPPISGGVAAENNLLVLSATGNSWIEVKDAQGNIQGSKILSRGEMVAISGVPPMSVVIGRADLVSVVVRGKPFDISTLAKDNVARFEVK